MKITQIQLLISHLLWTEVSELYLCGDEQGANHHEGEHVEAHVVVPLAIVQVTPEDAGDDADIMKPKNTFLDDVLSQYFLNDYERAVYFHRWISLFRHSF